MKEREKLQLPTVLSVEALNSIYHFDLAGRHGKGELHDFYELVFVEKGFYYVILDGERIVVPPGSCIFFAPNAFHSGDGITQATATVSIVSFDCTSSVMHYFDNRVFVLDEAERQVLQRFFVDGFRLCATAKMGGVCARESTAAYQLQLLKTELEIFLLGLYREETVEKNRSNRKQYRKESFRRLSDYMKAHLAERLTLSALAAACSMSESTIKALCREFCGCGPTDYLISLRITAAKTLIRQSTLNFTQIAERIGFGSLHYFSRVFKERTGQTPTQYAEAP